MPGSRAHILLGLTNGHRGQPHFLFVEERFLGVCFPARLLLWASALPAPTVPSIVWRNSFKRGWEGALPRLRDSGSKASACNAGDVGSIPGSGRSPGEGNGNPLQYSCLGNPKDKGARWATVHGVAKNRTQQHTHTHAYVAWVQEHLKICSFLYITWHPLDFRVCLLQM